MEPLHFTFYPGGLERSSSGGCKELTAACVIAELHNTKLEAFDPDLAHELLDWCYTTKLFNV